MPHPVQNPLQQGHSIQRKCHQKRWPNKCWPWKIWISFMMSIFEGPSFPQFHQSSPFYLQCRPIVNSGHCSFGEDQREYSEYQFHLRHSSVCSIPVLCKHEGRSRSLDPRICANLHPKGGSHQFPQVGEMLIDLSLDTPQLGAVQNNSSRNEPFLIIFV
jgi:hypothetical protein